MHALEEYTRSNYESYVVLGTKSTYKCNKQLQESLHPAVGCLRKNNWLQQMFQL
jgi:hypothetical protein